MLPSKDDFDGYKEIVSSARHFEEENERIMKKRIAIIIFLFYNSCFPYMLIFFYLFTTIVGKISYHKFLKQNFKELN